MNAYQKHLAHAQKKNAVWTETEILSLRMQVHKQKHVDDALTLIMNVNEGGYRITKEQREFGINWLRNTLWTKDGKERNTAKSRCFGDRERSIVKRFKKFTFEGLRYTQNGYSGYFTTTPIYRCHAKDGSFFDYTMAHWGLPEIL